MHTGGEGSKEIPYLNTNQTYTYSYIAHQAILFKQPGKIDELLDSMCIPLNNLYCTNVLCETLSHRSDIYTVCKQLVEVLLRAGHETLPQCKNNNSDFGTPLWNDEVEKLLCSGTGCGWKTEGRCSVK